jgi:spermidine synthase
MARAANVHKHLLADLWECPPHILDDEQQIRRTLLDAARRGGATVVDSTFHRFHGGGITGVVAVKESHLTIHTWPERGYAAVDIFLCGNSRPELSLTHLVTQLSAKRKTVREYLRGHPAEALAAPAAHATVHPMSRPQMTLLYLVTLVVAMCSIIYELLLAQTLSALLGNTVLRYSITIGCYLGALGIGALLCGSHRNDAGRQLIRVELALSALGGVAVPLFYFLDVVQRFAYMQAAVGSIWETLPPVLFLLSSHAVIVGIGLLSGFEVPLLLALGEELQPRSTNKLLAVDYFGALVGSVLFPLLLLRSFGLLATGFTVALVNACAALLLVIRHAERQWVWAGLMSAGIVATLAGALTVSSHIEQYFLPRSPSDPTSPGIGRLTKRSTW